MIADIFPCSYLLAHNETPVGILCVTPHPEDSTTLIFFASKYFAPNTIPLSGEYLFSEQRPLSQINDESDIEQIAKTLMGLPGNTKLICAKILQEPKAKKKNKINLINL